MNDKLTDALAGMAERYLDDPTVGKTDPRYQQQTLCATWLPLAHIDGLTTEAAAVSWEAAGMIASRWGEEHAEHVEQAIIAGAWGLATPAPSPATPLTANWTA